jgi:hypothetical protein
MQNKKHLFAPPLPKLFHFYFLSAQSVLRFCWVAAIEYLILMCQLGWHGVWDLAAAVYVSRRVKHFIVGAPVKVVWRKLVDVYLKLQVIHLRARVL